MALLRALGCSPSLRAPAAAGSRRWASTFAESLKVDARVFGIIAHVDAGKTTSTEQMLHVSGKLRRSSPGRVDAGSTVTDFLPQERERGITIQSAAVHFDWEGHSICLIDTPGHVDFGHEVERALRILDGAVVVIDAVAGAEAQTEAVARRAFQRGVPVIAVVNKMDRAGADFDGAMKSMRKRLSFWPPMIPIHDPIFESGEFQGFHDTTAAVGTPIFERLVEQLAEVDDDLAALYLAEAPVSSEAVRAALRRATLTQKCVPVLCASMLRAIGVASVLDAVVDFLPSPREAFARRHIKYDDGVLRALAFKVSNDKNRGPLVYARIYSGVWRPKDSLASYQQQTGDDGKPTTERATTLLKPFADTFEPMEYGEPGDIVVAVGLRASVTGSTITEYRAKGVEALEGIDAPSPVFTLALEPETASQFDDLERALKILCRDDPSLRWELDAESARLVIHGMGELHLDVAVDRLKREYGIACITGEAIVAYRESIEAHTGSAEHVYSRIMGTKTLFAGLTVRVDLAQSTADDGKYSPGAATVSVSPEAKASAASALFLDAILTGLQAAARRGPTIGKPLCSVVITCTGVHFNHNTTPAAAPARKLETSSDIRGSMNAWVKTRKAHVKELVRERWSVHKPRLGPARSGRVRLWCWPTQCAPAAPSSWSP
ncbi:P-loop containing nucleoside triphosphate hydrolase protein [Pelagophyceae sp. CCMP2097]|nr:P-loop containing nucleoside triphosphate hydrolase protein [Pelagophyceae sp. CCMP2097]